MKTPISINKTREVLKRMESAGLTCKQAMFDFGKAARLMNVSMQTVTDWRKFTIRKTK